MASHLLLTKIDIAVRAPSIYRHRPILTITGMVLSTSSTGRMNMIRTTNFMCCATSYICPNTSLFQYTNPYISPAALSEARSYQDLRRRSCRCRIDVGIYVTTARRFQKHMTSQHHQKWEGSLTFEKVKKYLPQFKSAINPITRQPGHAIENELVPNQVQAPLHVVCEP
jgi:restriction endonuclease BglII